MCVRDSLEWGIGVCVNKGGGVILDWERCCDELRNSCCRRDLSVAAGRRGFSTQAEKRFGRFGMRGPSIFACLPGLPGLTTHCLLQTFEKSHKALGIATAEQPLLPPPPPSEEVFPDEVCTFLANKTLCYRPGILSSGACFSCSSICHYGDSWFRKKLQRSCGCWPVICSSKPHGSWTSKNGHWAFNTTWYHWDDFEIFIMARTVLVQMLSFVHPFVKTRTADSKTTPNNLWWLTCNLVHKTSWLLDVQKTDI